MPELHCLRGCLHLFRAQLPLVFLTSFVAGMVASMLMVGVAQAQIVPVQVSKYWCDKFNGSYDGGSCTAAYAAHPGACKVFRELNVSDPAMTAILNEVTGARVCLAARVREAKINSLKLRANVMGYVTAGNPGLEDKMDPIKGSYRPEETKASYWAGVSYFLYQCVVETCTSK